MCLMQLGLFEVAWQETDRSEWQRRTTQKNRDDLPRHLRRIWNGTPLAGRTVRVHCNHGLGDTIQFCRYLKPLSQIAQNVCVEAQPRLVPLLQTMTSARPRSFISNSLDQEHFDAEVELMELPYFFRTSLETIPADIPYLHVPQRLSTSRLTELTSLGLSRDKLNVGLVWSSGDWNRQRDIGLQELEILGTIPEVQFFSLQRSAGAPRLPESSLLSPIVQTERNFGTPLDTAAAILQLDLIISVDTMVAHLAGALGKPVWTLLPYHADWRWMADRQDTPWYPTMRLFRQSRPGDWNQAIEEVRCELLKQTSQNRHADQTSSGSIFSF